MTSQLQQLSLLVQEFCEDREWDQYHSPKELAIGIVTEAAELLDEFRFLRDEECLQRLEDPSTRELIEDELADIFFFLLRFSQRFDIDLSRSLDRKLCKNAQRYPVESSKGLNLKARDLR